MNTFYFVCQQTIVFMVPLIIVACAGIFSERGGVLNFSLEGIMLAGAFCGALFLRGINDGTNLHYIAALFVAGLGGVFVILFHAIAAISFRGNQIVSGMAINLLVPPLTIVLGRSLVGTLQIVFANTFIIREVPGLSRIPIIGDIFFRQAYISNLLGLIVLFVAIFVMNKSKFGIHLRACGENPQAAASMGINVTRTRYIGVLISGFIGGMGGLAFIIPNATEYAATVAGYGYLAVGVVIFGQWNPTKMLLAALFFGFMKTISTIYSTIPFLAGLGLTKYWYSMVPYLATIVVLVFTSRRSGEPRALGQVFEHHS